MKEGSLGTAIKDNLLPTFKKDNNKEKSSDIIAKKIVWPRKVFNWPIRLLVIWLKKKRLKTFYYKSGWVYWELRPYKNLFRLSKKCASAVSTVTSMAICNPAV